MRRVAICCIDHALLLVSSVDVALDEEALRTLSTFESYRAKLRETLEAQNALVTPAIHSPLSRSGSNSFSQLPQIAGEKAAAKPGTESSGFIMSVVICFVAALSGWHVAD
jgi:hypothetical protein